MWLKVKNVILAHLALSVVVSLIVVVGIGGVGYSVLQKGNSSSNIKENTSDNKNLCKDIIKIGKIAVEKDPAGDPEAWLRFDYTTTANQARNCNYTITFYDNQEAIIRTIPNVEDTFQPTNGQIYNGYSSTPYQTGMTARVSVQ